MPIEDILFGRERERRRAVQVNRSRLVHYTSAEVAVSIVRNKELWMRKSSVMNDFREIEYGHTCFMQTYNSSSGANFRHFLESFSDGLLLEFQNQAFLSFHSIYNDTFITSVSEHELGRLSMWRAYGGSNAVALVFSPDPFVAATNDLKAYSVPVSYLTANAFADELSRIGGLLRNSIESTQTENPRIVLNALVKMFRYYILSTKHPGFSEEREWRVIYTPSVEKSFVMNLDHKTINGVFQPIYKIPLRDDPSKGLFKADLASLIDRIIIGPTQYPAPVAEAFVHLLKEAGVQDAATKVKVSNIPLRR